MNSVSASAQRPAQWPLEILIVYINFWNGKWPAFVEGKVKSNNLKKRVV